MRSPKGRVQKSHSLEKIPPFIPMNPFASVPSASYTATDIVPLVPKVSSENVA